MLEPKAYLGNDPYIFVSYAHDDKDIDFAFIAALQERYNVWFDEGLTYGKKYEGESGEIMERIDRCSCFMILVTARSLKSDWCWKELRHASEKEKQIVPCLAQDFFSEPLKDMEEWKKFESEYGKIQSLQIFRFSILKDAVSDLARKCEMFEAIKNAEIKKYSKGLAFQYNKKEDAYCITGIGECIDTEITIPSIAPFGKQVTAIAPKAFYGCTSLTSIIIPDGVTVIGNSAFDGCTGLMKITIPNSVTHIGNRAFFHCIGLTSATIGSNVKSIGHSAFADCKSLANVSIPDSVNDIGNRAFFHCTNLTNAIIGNRVKVLGKDVFSDCKSLISITIGSGVTNIDSAFNHCISLTDVYITDLASWCGISFNESSSNPLYYAHNLYIKKELITKLEIPYSVTDIGDHTFYGCTSLTSVMIPNNVKRIGNNAFQRCTNLTSVTIGNGITDIGKHAFFDCSRLKSAIIGSNVTSIGNSAFFGCSDLTSIVLPNGLTGIEDWVFSGCINLKSVTIGNQVKALGHKAFFGCLALMTITLPGSVTSIGNSTFDGCSNLTSITYLGTKAKWKAIKKHALWREGADFCIIHCINGDVKK